MNKCTACKQDYHGKQPLCAGCRKYQRRMHYGDNVARNPHKLSIQRTRWSKHGQYAPPFRAGTPEYMNWYRDMQAQARRSDLLWPEFYARAKEEAHNNPVSTQRVYRRHRALFGGAKSAEYRQWYYRTQREHAALPVNEQNWPKFFAAAREKAMQKQGLQAQGFSKCNTSDLRTKPATSVEDTPDVPLRFDFTIPAHFNHHLVNDNDNERQNHHG